MKTRILSYILIVGSCALFGQTAEEILDNSAKAQLNGNNIEEYFSLQTKGSMQMPGGMEATFEIFQKEGGKFYMKTSIPSVGMEVEQGCNGKDCYSVDPMIGPRLLEGEELANSLLEADFQSEFKWRDTFATYKLIGEETVEGRPCYKMDLVTKAGLELTSYYEKETFLIRRIDTVVENEMMGKVTGKIYFDHYQEFQGILLPTQKVMEMISNRIEMKMTDYQFNVKMDESIFKIPETLNQPAK